MSFFRTVSIILIAVFAFSGARAADIKLPEYQTLTLDHGATVLLMPRKDVPLIAANIAVRGGALADAPGKEGTANLLGEMLSKGAGNRTALQFAQTVDGAGGSLGFGSSREAIVANAQFLSKDSALMLSLLADALLRPTMDAAEFDKLRKRAIDGIANAKDSDPRQLIGTYTGGWLFRGHPYGRSTGGDETSLATITLADLQAYRQQQMGGDRLVIAIAGDFDANAVTAQLKQSFGAWPKASGNLPRVDAKARETGRRVLLVDKPGATQTYFWFGNVGSGFDDPARSAQDLVQTVFGGRFTSMLNTELRVKSGLTYGARAAIDRHVQPGAAAIVSFTRTDATQQALDLALSVLDTLHAKGLDAAMLESGRNYDLGQFPPQLETAPQLAAQLSTLALYGLGDDEINGYAQRLKALDLAAVNAATSVFARSTDLAIVLIGDAKAIRDVAATYGPVTEMALADPRFAPAK